MVLSDKNKEIKELLSEGADERIFLDEQGLSKYGISLVNTETVNRGSCTASPATKEDMAIMEELLEKQQTRTDWIEAQEQRTQQLKTWLNEKEEDLFEIFYAPSGTDLFYYPIMFGKLLNPDKKIINLVTCKEELGSGTPYAAGARYYSNYNQFGDKITKNDTILQPDELETIFFEARSADGQILNHNEKIRRLIYQNPDNPIIVNLVYGSKSGISDNIKIIDKVDASNVIWSIDMCQLRHQRDIIRMMLKKNAMVMITGSKFYQAPPFCAALLVPNNVYNKILNAEKFNQIDNFGSIFSKYDLPKTLRDKINFPDKLNISGSLRWALTVNEINKYYNFGVERTEEIIERWNTTMINEIKNRDNFELMPSQEITNKSIISFRVKINGSYLDHQQLKKLHRAIVTSDYKETYGFSTLFIGQPVAYENKSFLRIAIGSKNVRRFADTNEQKFDLDKNILTIIATKLKELYDH